LSSPLPLEKNLSWDKVADSFSNVENVEIHIDLDALEEKVTAKASTLFKKHFKNDDD
jgi:competence transcription factor ComK